MRRHINFEILCYLLLECVAVGFGLINKTRQIIVMVIIQIKSETMNKDFGAHCLEHLRNFIDHQNLFLIIGTFSFSSAVDDSHLSHFFL